MRLSFIKQWLFKYKQTVETVSSRTITPDQSDIAAWKDRLFMHFLIYCFPVSLVAVIPGIYVSLAQSLYLIALIDSLCFLLVTYVTFSVRLSFSNKKKVIVGMFYVLAVFLIAMLGYIGPGVFYLLAITMFIALFLTIRAAYYSIALNGAILAFFAIIIYLKPFASVLTNQYEVGGWIACSSNLIFLGIVLVSLIEKIFNGLQSTIEKKERHKIKYKNIFEHNPLPMWLFDPTTLRFLDVNQAAVSHYGYSREEFLNMTILDIRPEDDRAYIEDVVRNNKETYKFYHNRLVHRKKNGDVVSVKVDSSMLEFNGYKAKLVLANDITLQLKNEQEVLRSNIKVKQSESNLRAIFDSAVQGFVLLDAENRIVLFNLKAHNSVVLANNPVEFVTGRSVFDYVEPSGKRPLLSSLDAVKQGEIIEFDRKYGKEDNVRWIHYSLTPVFDGGVVVGTCITGNDITERRNYLETIENQNKTFREISWIQSHLVRAPLARIMGLTTLIATETNEAEKAEMITLLQISSKELDDIITDITEKSVKTQGSAAKELVPLLSRHANQR